MKHPFSFTLEGKDWSRLYLWYWTPSLLLLILNLIRKEPPAGDSAAVLGNLFLSLAISFLTMLVQSYFTVPVLRTWLPRLSVDGKAFSFAGDTNDYLLLNVKGFLLSVVTVGIYLPWYARNVLDFLARETSFEGSSARFTGKPGRLLAWFLGVFFGALVATFLVVWGLVSLGSRTGLSGGEPGASSFAITAVTFGLVVLLVCPLVYLIYSWMVQFTWNGRTVRWTTRFWPATATVLVQVVLTVCTLGIWWPGAVLCLYRYFAARTVVEGEGTLVRFSFEGKTGEGFLLLWGQALLTLVSLGFYGAWSGPKVTRWIAERTFAEEAPAGFIPV